MIGRSPKVEFFSRASRLALWRRPVDKEAIKRILVRGPNWLGDAVMCEPALRGLRRLFPDAQIALLVKPAVADLFIGHPALTHVLTYDSKGRHAGLPGKWALAGQLRRQGFDLAILFQNAFEAAFLTFLAGVPRRYGYATDGRSLLLSDSVAVPDRRMLVHQVRYYWDLLKPLGLTGDPPAPELVVFPEEEQAMAGRFAQGGLTAHGYRRRHQPRFNLWRGQTLVARTVRRGHGPTQAHHSRISRATSQRRDFWRRRGRAFGTGHCCASIVQIPGFVRCHDDPGTHGGVETVCHASHE